MDALRRYSWPGNVRELQNVIERAAVLTRAQTITVDDLPENVRTNDAGVLGGGIAAIGGRTGMGSSLLGDAGEWEPMPLEEALREPERRILLRALEANDWNRQRTADQLDINRTTLYKKMKSYGIDAARHAG